MKYAANKAGSRPELDANILSLFSGIVLFAAGFASGGAHSTETAPIVLFALAWLAAGYAVLAKAALNFAHGHVFDENLLMTVATVGAAATGQFPEAAAVMLFYKLGMILENKAVGHSRKSIAGLIALKPDIARVKRESGFVETAPEEVAIGDIMLAKPGERIPVDCVVLEGESLVDTSPLTGESLPEQVGPGSQVYGGTINKTGLLTLKAANTLKQSAVARILELVEKASSGKAPLESFIHRFARYYTPAVIVAAFLVAVIPPLATGGGGFRTWLYRAMIFLVASCPCALVVSIPLVFFAGIGRASSAGILVKGGNYLETLNKVDTVVFDKTGTLTEGEFAVVGLIPNGCTEDELLEYAAYAEYNSNHPVAQSITRAYKGRINASLVSRFEETAGRGAKAVINNKTVVAGTLEFLKSAGLTAGPDSEDNAENFGIDVKSANHSGNGAGGDRAAVYGRAAAEGTIVHVSVDNEYKGRIIVSDKLKKDAAESIAGLKASGISRVIMLTGDAKEPAEAVAGELGIDEVHYGLLPHQKVEWLEKIKKGSGGKTAFAGDGINDAPVLAMADVGISMGGIGSDAAIEASDMVIMTDRPSKIAEAVKIARITHRIAVQNVVFAISVKVLVLLLGTLGISAMWEAVFADVGVTLLAVLNSLRVGIPRSSKKLREAETVSRQM